MPGNDQEVFSYLTADLQTSIHLDYLTYAIFAHEKNEWIRHWEAQKGSPPSQIDIDNWISNITDHQFRIMMDTAVNFFDAAARDYLAEEVKSAKEEALRSALLNEVRAASSFWRQLGMALITAIIAPLLLGGIIALALIYDRWFPTIEAISNSAR